MTEPLVCSNNSLSDLVKWSNMGYTIILNSQLNYKIFSRQEFINFDKIIKINFSSQWESLIHDGEWPYYLIECGCKEMNSEDFLNLNLTNVVEFYM